MDNEILMKQSGSCSSVCRQIVFALGALSWGVVYLNIENECVDIFPLLALVLVILYFSFDIIQYLYSYVESRKVAYNIYCMNQDESCTDEERREELTYYTEKQIDIERKAFRVFIVKILFLPFILFTLLIHFALLLFQ